ncbi:hypothetical protein SteCoe_31451 [Stentor coeruleus]|uniref:Uncharacterized protein n=1 Tax=Stentor coeruleus TaxID=5963 RepID=A0A1R2B1B1_9CILI|nr:hypothetical protein SteCoe_31451 [Stentor coeruleus]
MKGHCCSCCFSEINKQGAEATYNKILTSNTSFALQKNHHFSQNTSESKIWFSKSKTPEQINKMRNVKLMQELFYKDSPDSERIESGLNIFKALADLCQRHEIYLNMPETIIMGYGLSSPVMLYTNEKGILSIQKELNNAHLRIILDLFEKYRIRSDQKHIGPLAIKREPDSKYNRIMMNQSEIILEWKDAYKVNVIIQRFILSKGMKTSKLRIAMGNEIKIYKIVNKSRQDLKNDSVIEPKITNPANCKQKVGQKNIFNDIAEENKKSVLFNSTEVLNVFSKSEETSKVKEPSPKFLAPKRNNECLSRQSTEKFMSRKSLIPSREPINYSQKRLILNISDYFESCKGSMPTKSIEELKKDIKNCKQEDCDFTIDAENMIYTNYYRNNINELFNVSTRFETKTDIFEIKSTKSFSRAIEMMHELKRIINGFCLKGRKLSKLICDFKEDEYQNVYFIKIAQAEYTDCKLRPIKSTQISSSFICPGKYCDNEIKRHKTDKMYKMPKYTILKKAIIDHMKVKEGDPIELLNPRLYEKVQVCRRCFEVYMQKFAGMRRHTSGMQLKIINKNEATSIINDINPSTAAETVKTASKSSLPFGQTASTKFTDYFGGPLNNITFANNLKKTQTVLQKLLETQKFMR